MAKNKAKPEKHTPRIVNRKARFDYAISDSFEVGIVLKGSEVKSIRNSHVTLAEGFARVEEKTMELILYNVNIGEYAQATGINGHEPTRPRKLLAHKREIRRLLEETHDKGTTLVPLTMYFTRGICKVEIGIGKGKRTHDKRETVKKRDSDREIRSHLTRRKI